MKIGIDPGLGGAIAFISDKEIKVFDMPVCPVPWSRKNKKMVDTKGLYNLINWLTKGQNVECMNLEIVHSMPLQGVSSVWTFSGAFHSALTVINQFDCKINMIDPKIWKKKYGLINMPKDASRLLVLRMYPELNLELARKKDNDRAEAILIAGCV